MRYCVIMCGGVGSRFWPFSRDAKPKQFLDFFGSGRSLLQMTVDRVAPLVDYSRILLVTNAAYRDLIHEQLPEIPEENILAEPARRNTAPCILWAAKHIAALDPEASMVVLPSDHLILKDTDFRQTLEEGFRFVESHDALMTLGILPGYPNTGYGYIQKGDEVEGWPGINKVRLFTEKPNLEMATRFVESKQFYWNAGIFLWSAKSILKAFDKYAEDVALPFDSESASFGTPEEGAAIARIFPSAPSISIDYAVMEKADNVYVKGADIGWSDLGTWNSLYETSPKNEQKNVTQNCRVLANDCEGSLFAATGDKLIVALGLKDYIVADNGNSLLLCPRDREQEVKETVAKIRNLFGEAYL